MKTGRFKYQPVERLPRQLDNGVLYHSDEFEVAALSCACGCGHRVMLLVPDSHQVTSRDGMATVRPSISVCDAPCRSHYIITAGAIEWLPDFSPAQASSVMRNQIARHVDRDAKPATWGVRIRAVVAHAIDRLRSLFRL